MELDDEALYPSLAGAPGRRGRRPGYEPALPEEPELWERLRRHGDAEARQTLLDMHMPYAKVVAATYYGRRLNDEIEFGDYMQLASLGLLESVERFDPAMGVQFRTFAARRMHGSILDGLERLTEKQQQIAARQRLELQRRNSIRSAMRADWNTGGQKVRSPDQLLQYVAEAGLAFALAWLLDGTGMVQEGESSASMPFYRNVELSRLRRRVIELVEALPPSEKRVIRSHYFQEIPFDEIARSMQLSAGRISQIHRRGLHRLGESLRPHHDCDVYW